MRFAGIDLGWERRESGLALLDWDGASLTLAALDVLSSPDEIAAWLDAHCGAGAVVAIDAPTVIPNETGMRAADRLTHSLYGKYDAGAYPASRARRYWQRTTGFSQALEALGFAHGDAMPSRAAGRWQIEVYPNAAMVQLFSLGRIVKYKRGTLASRVAALRRFRLLLLRELPRLTPALAPPRLPSVPSGGAALKRVEDQLDALLCAYVAAHWWYWGRALNDVLGDASQGYIVVPRRRAARVPLADLRQSYLLAGLLESDLHPDPVTQFHAWLDQALAAQLPEPNAMTLATAGLDGHPDARIVLLKDAGPGGFVFFTNYESAKGRQLDENPHAALVFYWPQLERQVRVAGSVSRLPPEDSEAYFLSRPRGHQLGAWASPQSSVIESRESLERRLAGLEERFARDPVPRPPYWGGYRLAPHTIEFWQGRPNRLHDRIRYRALPGGAWLIERLAP